MTGDLYVRSFFEGYVARLCEEGLRSHTENGCAVFDSEKIKTAVERVLPSHLGETINFRVVNEKIHVSFTGSEAISWAEGVARHGGYRGQRCFRRYNDRLEGQFDLTTLRGLMSTSARKPVSFGVFEAEALLGIGQPAMTVEEV